MSKLMDFTPLALKNLFSKPATRNYPAEQRDYPIRSRGHIVNDFDSCILCGICQKKCPSDAITVNRAEKSWSINRMGCVQCSNCVNACPKKCLSIVPGYTERKRKAVRFQTIYQNACFAASAKSNARMKPLRLTERKQKPGQLTLINALNAVRALINAPKNVFLFREMKRAL